MDSGSCMAAAGCICVVCIGLDASAICSTSRKYGSWFPLGLLDSVSHVRVGLCLCLCEFVAKESAKLVPDVLAGCLEVVGTAVSSCSASSLAVVGIDTLSMDRRDMISSRVDAFMGRMEKREESALERRLGPLEGVAMVADE